LALFVLGIFTNNSDATFAAYNLALVANLLDWSSNFHFPALCAALPRLWLLT